MDTENSLKTWVRKHSPLKSKPLPPSPGKDRTNFEERALNPISNNVSPTRRLSKSKLRTLLKQNPHPTSPPGSPPATHRATKSSTRRQSMPHIVATVEHTSPIRKPVHIRGQSADLHRLSSRIDELESQLREAREELVGVTRRASMSLAEHRPLRKADYQTQLYKYDHGPDMYDVGFVTNLPHQRDRDVSTRGLRCRSSVEIGPIEQPGHIEGSGNTEAQTMDLLDPNTSQHKRKRSKLRQQSWEQLQNHLTTRRQLTTPTGQPDSKRLRKGRTKSINVANYRAKDLPELPQFPIPDALASKSDFFAIATSDIAEQENQCPTLDRNQQHFSEPVETAEPVVEQPRPSRHRRNRSQIIDAEDVRRVFTPSESENWVTLAEPIARPPSRKSGGAVSVPRSANPPSPTRRHCVSPARLDVVREEFEWDEEVF